MELPKTRDLIRKKKLIEFKSGIDELGSAIVYGDVRELMIQYGKQLLDYAAEKGERDIILEGINFKDSITNIKKQLK